MKPHFVAEIELLSTDQGGRAGPLIDGEWRTVLAVHDAHWSARLIFPGQPAPGQSFRSEVELLLPAAALQYFSKGTLFQIWEGGTKGNGRVISTTLPESRILEGLPAAKEI